MMRRLILLISLVISLLVGGISNAVASAPYVFGTGSRNIAMGGAATAAVFGPTAIFYNPAALAKTHIMDMEIGYYYLEPEALKLDRLGPRNPVFGPLYPDTFDEVKNPRAIQGINFGVARRLFKYFVVGVYGFIPTRGLMRLWMGAPDDPYWLDYTERAQSLYLSAALSADLGKWFSVGVGTSMLANMDSQMKAVVPFGGPGFGSLAGPATFAMDGDMTHDFSINAGIHFHPIKYFEAGVSYRGTLDMDVTSDTIMVFTPGTGVDGPSILATPISLRGSGHFIPQEVTFGVVVHPIEQLSISADLSWTEWTAYVPPLFNAYTMDGMQFNRQGHYTHPDGLLLINSVVPAPSFNDTLTPRVGVEYKPWPFLALRGGYYYKESPVPPQIGVTNILDSDTHVASGGFGIKYKDPLRIIKGEIFFDFHFQLFFLDTETNMKNINMLPTIGEPAGPNTSFINPTVNKGFPGYSEGGFLYSLGATTGIRF